MHAFEFILVLFSFVYAAATPHVLSTAGDLGKVKEFYTKNSRIMCSLLSVFPATR